MERAAVASAIAASGMPRVTHDIAVIDEENGASIFNARTTADNEDVRAGRKINFVMAFARCSIFFWNEAFSLPKSFARVIKF